MSVAGSGMRMGSRTMTRQASPLVKAVTSQALKNADKKKVLDQQKERLARRAGRKPQGGSVAGTVRASGAARA